MSVLLVQRVGKVGLRGWSVGRLIARLGRLDRDLAVKAVEAPGVVEEPDDAGWPGSSGRPWPAARQRCTAGWRFPGRRRLFCFRQETACVLLS